MGMITTHKKCVLPFSGGETLLGEPDRVEKIGTTEIPYQIFLEFILNLGETRYKKGSFNLQDNNGINFADDVAQFVCSISIPKYLLHLPHIVFETPFGEDEVIPLLDRISERGQTIGEGIQRSQNFLQNYVPRAPGKTRELSPDLLELQAEIDAIRANYRSKPKPPPESDSDDSVEENNFRSAPKVKFSDKDILPKKFSPPAISTKNPILKDNSLTKVATEEAEKATLCHPEEIQVNHCENNKETENSPKVENINNCDSSKDLTANK